MYVYVFPAGPNPSGRSKMGAGCVAGAHHTAGVESALELSSWRDGRCPSHEIGLLMFLGQRDGGSHKTGSKSAPTIWFWTTLGDGLIRK